MILVLLGIEGGDKDCVVVTMLDGQDVLITAGSYCGESPSFIYVKLGDWFGQNVHLI